MKTYGLIGKRLSHSYSPTVHAQLGRAIGEQYDYELFECDPEELESLIRNKNCDGFNVTIPYKKTVLAFCDEISDEVLHIGAANAIIKKGDKICAHNTDYYGFRYMVYASGIKFGNKKVLVLGSGGASQAIKTALHDLGARETVIISRTGAFNYENLHLHSDAEIIINTTPVGMYPENGKAPLDLRAFTHLCGVLDLIYNPSLTELLLEAERLGIPHIGGIHMLVAQAKASYELFTGKRLPDKIINDTVRYIERDTQNIILTGMPGCGKSVIAKALQEMTGKAVIDTDEIIENRTGMTIPEIFRKRGETAFRVLESEVIREVSKNSSKIISLGGGAVLNPENYSPLHQNGKIFFIRRDTELLATDGRPLSKSPETLKQMQEIRLPLYRDFCDTEVENDGTIEDAASQILKKM